MNIHVVGWKCSRAARAAGSLKFYLFDTGVAGIITKK